MRILALDLGTHCGFAHNCISSEELVSGTWHTATPKEITRWKKDRMDRRCDQRIIRFAASLNFLALPHGTPEIVVFEDVQFMGSLYQAQLWSSFRATIWNVFGGNPGIIIDCISVQTLKKFAGHGSADKAAMARFLRARHPEVCKPEMDDNEVDALWLYVWAKENLGRIKNV